jgi:hypothetical protein
MYSLFVCLLVCVSVHLFLYLFDGLFVCRYAQSIVCLLQHICFLVRVLVDPFRVWLTDVALLLLSNCCHTPPAPLLAQKLVNRLNKYGRYHMELFTEVVGIIHEEVLPQIRKCGQAGFTEYRTSASPFLESALACEMLIDVLSDRGFSCSHMVEERMIPYKAPCPPSPFVHSHDLRL